MIVALALLSFPGWAAASSQGGSGLRGLESMRLSDIGQTLSDWRLLLLIAGSVLVIILLWGGDAIRPGSLNRSGLRNVNPLPPPVWIMAGLIIWLAPQLAYAPLAEMGWITGGGGDDLRATAAPQGLAYLAGMAVAFGLMQMAQRAAPQSGLKLDWIDLPVGLGLLLLVSPIILLSGDLAVLVHTSLSSEGVDSIAHPTLTKIASDPSDPWAWVLIASAVIGAPVVEEVVFRGFLQSGMFRITRHAWGGVISTAIIFGVLHAWPAGEGSLPWYAAVQVGVLGLCCGAAFERTKHIGVPIAMHAAFNAANIAVALWQGGG